VADIVPMNESSLRLRILENATFGAGPKRPDRDDVHVQPSRKPPPAANMRAIIESEVARIIEALPAPGESVQRAFDRKECELRTLFVSLTRAERIALHASLTAERSSVLARLTGERRGRVLASLAEVSRANGGGL
jgi:hypothetical protein